MEIVTKKDGNALVIELEGRLDTTTAPELENVVNTELTGITDLTLDFVNLAYISSAGLRVLLSMQKIMNKQQGSMVIKNVNDEIKEVFEITGFSDIFTVE